MQLITRKLNYTKLLKKLKYLKLNPTSLNPEVQTRMGVHAAIRTQDGRGIGTEMGRKEETRRRRLNRQAATGRNGLFKIKKGKLPSRCIRFRGVVWVIHFILLTEHKPTFSRLRIPPPVNGYSPNAIIGFFYIMRDFSLRLSLRRISKCRHPLTTPKQCSKFRHTDNSLIFQDFSGYELRFPHICEKLIRHRLSARLFFKTPA